MLPIRCVCGQLKLFKSHMFSQFRYKIERKEWILVKLDYTAVIRGYCMYEKIHMVRL